METKTLLFSGNVPQRTDKQKRSKRYKACLIAGMLLLQAGSLLAQREPQLVADLNPGIASSDPLQVTVLRGTTYFLAKNGATYGQELWKKRGNRAPILVKDIYSGSDESSVISMYQVNGTLYLVVYLYGTELKELWKSDGTEAGTVKVHSSIVHYDDNAPIATTKDKLLFVDESNPNQLWATDGTPTGTKLIKEVSYPTNLTSINGQVYFSSGDGKLYKTDGTATGTQLLKEINPEKFIHNLTKVNGYLFFNASEAGNIELWKSDGTPSGTFMVKQIKAPVDQYPNASNLTNVKGTLYFTIENPTTKKLSIWRSNGSLVGTKLVKDLPFDDNVFIRQTAALNGSFYFIKSIYNQTGAFITELWKSDGSADGTVLVKGMEGPSANYNLASVNGHLYFNASDWEHGFELWQSNGTAQGTVRVSDINPGPESSSPQILGYTNKTLYLAATEPTSGRELYQLNLKRSATKEAILENTSKSARLIAYPNPVLAQSSVQLEAKGLGADQVVTIQLQDLTGQVVYKAQVRTDSQGQLQTSLTTQGLKASLYTITLTTPEEIQRVKLLVSE